LSAALSLLAGRELENNPAVAMLAAGGFRDCTRVAAGPAWLGADMVTGNYEQLRRLAEDFKKILGELLSASPAELESRLSEAGANREALLQAKEERSRAP
jgi:prephenate dehydrogenase